MGITNRIDERVTPFPGTEVIPTDPKELFKLVKSLAPEVNYETFPQFKEFFERIPIEYAVYCISTVRDLERQQSGKVLKPRLLRENQLFKNFLLKHYDFIQPGFLEKGNLEKWVKEHE